MISSSVCNFELSHPQIPDGVCAILYDDQNCRDRALIGWSEELKEGEKTLGLLHKNDAESVLVKAGCTFRGQVALRIITNLNARCLPTTSLFQLRQHGWMEEFDRYRG